MSAVYMILKLGSIKGEAKKKDRTNWIKLQKYEHGVSQDITPQDMAGRKRAGNPRFSFLSVNKQVDIATPDILIHCIRGKNIPQVELEIYQAETDLAPLIKYTLTNCFIASAETYGDDQNNVSEEIAISYSTVKLDVQGVNIDGEMGKGWDIAGKDEIK
jgi:type VI secretion system secreted protein Hcp